MWCCRFIVFWYYPFRSIRWWCVLARNRCVWFRYPIPVVCGLPLTGCCHVGFIIPQTNPHFSRTGQHTPSAREKSERRFTVVWSSHETDRNGYVMFIVNCKTRIEYKNIKSTNSQSSILDTRWVECFELCRATEYRVVSPIRLTPYSFFPKKKRSFYIAHCAVRCLMFVYAFRLSVSLFVHSASLCLCLFSLSHCSFVVVLYALLLRSRSKSHHLNRLILLRAARCCWWWCCCFGRTT